jgi:predicted RecA/RadA family phage recombinase
MQKLRKTLVTGLTLAAIAGLAAATPSAHHSFAMYDQSIKYVFTGVVERINPDAGHLQIFFVPLNENRDALLRDDSGKRVTWLVEMGGAAASAREGITVDGFQPGTVFSVGLVPLRNGQRGGARVEGLFSCPKGKPPAAGRHCDSVEGAQSHGDGALVKPTAAWKP